MSNGGNGGKGSAPRPYTVDSETFASNWDRIFGKKDQPITVTVPADLPKEPGNPSMPPCQHCGSACWRYYVSGPWCKTCWGAAVDEQAP